MQSTEKHSMYINKRYFEPWKTRKPIRGLFGFRANFWNNFDVFIYLVCAFSNSSIVWISTLLRVWKVNILFIEQSNNQITSDNRKTKQKNLCFSRDTIWRVIVNWFLIFSNLFSKKIQCHSKCGITYLKSTVPSNLYE